MKQGPSAGFFLHNSNLLEVLCEKAIKILDEMPSADPLLKTEIVVQSDGMGKWLALKIAEKTGIYANISSLTIEKYLQKTAVDLLNIDLNEAVFNSENMRWTIYDILNRSSKPVYKILNSYISGDSLKRYLMAGKCADLFDQYSVYRFEMVSQWKKGHLFYKSDKDEKWQKELFAEISNIFPDQKDRVSFLNEFIEKCNEIKYIPDSYKRGIILFGISTMSEYHLAMYSALSKIIPVHLFFMNPCVDFWGDIVTTKKSEISKLLENEELYFESPNRFLADLGISGKIFFNSLHEADAVDDNHFEESATAGTMLKKIQKEILNMNELEKFSFDNSIKINGCWGKTREMEVLKDELLDIFNSNPEIKPDDVVVIAPDIEEYSPYIEAVFGTKNNDTAIPFSIADKSAKSDGRIVDTFMKILKLLESDFKKSDLLSIFETESVYKNFNLSRSDLETVRTAVEQSGIKWGIDKRFRETKNFPPFEQNTWKFGFERMILGYSMPGGGLNVYGGVLPYDEIEGTSAKTIAKFITFCEILFKNANTFNMDRNLIEWGARLNTLIDEIFVDDAETANEINLLRIVMDKMSRQETISKLSCAVPLRVVTLFLEESFASSGFNRGFLNGNVTFCSIRPLRCIPFKVVCMIGMNDEFFPREQPSIGFDLIKKYPSPKDRNSKNSDKYFFLESMLSARDFFIVSYNARSVRDSSVNLCSSPVRILSDYLFEKSGSFKEILHPLQPFSAKYFNESSSLFTFSGKDHAAYVSFTEKNDNVPSLLKLESEINENLLILDFNDLISFFMNPPRYFLRKRMGMTVPYIREPEDDKELFTIDSLKSFNFKNEYLEMFLKGKSISDFKRKMKGEGKVPHGPAGQILLSGAINEMESYLSKVKSYKNDEFPAEISFIKTVSTGEKKITVSGKLDSVYSSGQLFFKPSKTFNSKDKMKWWISHLFMNSTGIMKNTCLVGMESDIEFSPVDDPDELLTNLIGVYYLGISKPLPVTPFIIENISSELNRGETVENAFAKMLEKKNSPWGGSSDDFPFKTVANMTGFYSGDQKTISMIADISETVLRKFEKYKQESK